MLMFLVFMFLGGPISVGFPFFATLRIFNFSFFTETLLLLQYELVSAHLIIFLDQLNKIYIILT